MNERNENTADIEDQRFVTKAKEVFDQSVDALDAETRSRLNRDRHEALAQTGVSHTQWLRWAPATGVAAAALVAVVVLTGKPPVDDLAPITTAGDFEILLDEESFEMLEELEFYSWIEFEGEVDTNGNVG